MISVTIDRRGYDAHTCRFESGNGSNGDFRSNWQQQPKERRWYEIATILIEDTRQQAKKHDQKHRWFSKHGIHVVRNALACGDYQLAGKSDIAVDTKKDIAELIGDIQVKQMAKKDVAAAVRDISVKFNIKPELQSQIYHLIVDDDSERLVEAELVRLCMDSGIPEYAISLFQSLYVKRHGFFHRGLVRAKFYGTKLYVLVENNDGVKDIDSLFRWVNPRTKITVPDYTKPIGRWHNGAVRYARKRKYPNCMQGQTLAKACLTMEKKYGVKFVFCRPEESGEMIMELLQGKGVV